MNKYIDAEKLIAEIERREKIIRNSANQISDSEKRTYYSGCSDSLLELLPFISSLQQEQPEVDLDKEYSTWWNSISGKINVEHMMEWYMHETARHFFELGQSEMRKRIANPEYNKTVLEKMKVENPLDENNARKEK